MEFRLELQIKPWKQQLNLRDKVMLLGSCFTEHMSAKLAQSGFGICENPHGILFNPVSILNSLEAHTTKTTYDASDLFHFNGLWHSWHHHGRFISVDPEEALKLMNNETSIGSGAIRSTNWLIITLGSAFVYELKQESGFDLNGSNRVVANCHKVPAQHFIHRLLSYQEVQAALDKMIVMVRSKNPGVKIVFTISPVRHYREGLVENNRSKGLLHNAVGAMESLHENVCYFPAYELINDDLRDYRYFAEDLVHPNYQATQYVWEKFTAACIDEESRVLMERISKINGAMQHRPRQPESEQHKAFLQKMQVETRALKELAPFLKLDDALAFFSR
jgi:hypothetical protein